MLTVAVLMHGLGERPVVTFGWAIAALSRSLASFEGRAVCRGRPPGLALLDAWVPLRHGRASAGLPAQPEPLDQLVDDFQRAFAVLVVAGVADRGANGVDEAVQLDHAAGHSEGDDGDDDDPWRYAEGLCQRDCEVLRDLALRRTGPFRP
jgi:hypothetical protein